MNYRINVYEVKREESNVKAYANVAFGESFVVRNVAIVERKDGTGVFVSMPSYRSNEVDQDGQHVYKSVANPITKEFNEELTSAILEAYEKRSDLGRNGLKCGEGSDEPSFNVSVNVFDREGSHTKGLARVYLEDSFVVQNISIVEGKRGLFVSMPAYKTGKGNYQDIAFPISKDFRTKLFGAILDTYEQERKKPRDDKSKGNDQKSKADASKDEFLSVGDMEELPFR